MIDAELAWARSSKVRENLISGSPAFSMMMDDFRPGPTSKSRQIDATPPCGMVRVIESAGEPEISAVSEHSQSAMGGGLDAPVFFQGAPLNLFCYLSHRFVPSSS
jgi:hypothetical protein